MLAWLLSMSPALAEAPEIATCAVLAPVFAVGDKSYPAGTAFALVQGDKTLLVTAHHLLGPAAGMPVQITGPEIPEKVKQVVVRDAFTGVECGRATKGLVMADATSMSAEGGAKDLAAFVADIATGLDRIAKANKAPLATRTLAAAAPAVGDPVWMTARVKDREAKAFEAKVVEVLPTGMYYQFADADIDLTATSGAAIVDAAGAVVGVHLGGGKMDDGALIGTANPLTSVRTRLEAALGEG